MSDAKKGWLARIAGGLGRTSSRLKDGISGIVTGRKLDDAAIEALEELLITSDLGVATASRLTAELARTRFGSEVTADEVRDVLAGDIEKILAPVAKPLEIDLTKIPHVVLVVGVNGVGKTTTIGKLARHYMNQGRSVMLAAGDTYRAAGVRQLQLWGERIGCPVIARDTGSDAAGLAFDALTAAREAETELLIIDTAGRLHNRADLIAGLEKIIRVVKKIDPDAPHSCLLVLDATTGQNAHAQVDVFREMANVSGLIVTKLDGSAKGGVLVALADKHGLPVHAIGVGEDEDDLRPFEAGAYARGLMGLNPDIDE